MPSVSVRLTLDAATHHCWPTCSASANDPKRSAEPPRPQNHLGHRGGCTSEGHKVIAWCGIGVWRHIDCISRVRISLERYQRLSVRVDYRHRGHRADRQSRKSRSPTARAPLTPTRSELYGGGCLRGLQGAHASFEDGPVMTGPASLIFQRYSRGGRSDRARRPGLERDRLGRGQCAKRCICRGERESHRPARHRMQTGKAWVPPMLRRYRSGRK